jgi:hypothetical protein
MESVCDAGEILRRMDNRWITNVSSSDYLNGNILFPFIKKLSQILGNAHAMKRRHRRRMKAIGAVARERLVHTTRQD